MVLGHYIFRFKSLCGFEIFFLQPLETLDAKGASASFLKDNFARSEGGGFFVGRGYFLPEANIQKNEG